MSSIYRWIKVDGTWEPAREQADGSYMPIGDIVPMPARAVKIGPVIEPPPKNAPRKEAVAQAPASPHDESATPDEPLNPA